MQDFVLDSFALVAFFRNEKGAGKIEKLLIEALNKTVEVYICSLNAGEIYYSIWRKNGKAVADSCLEKILQFEIRIIEPDLQLTFEASAIKATHKLSYAGAHAAALSLHLNATLITGDKEFKNLKDISAFKVEFL
jgi:ribonuclease VapC